MLALPAEQPADDEGDRRGLQGLGLDPSAALAELVLVLVGRSVGNLVADVDDLGPTSSCLSFNWSLTSEILALACALTSALAARASTVSATCARVSSIPRRMSSTSLVLSSTRPLLLGGTTRTVWPETTGFPISRTPESPDRRTVVQNASVPVDDDGRSPRCEGAP